jgi:hypothetical protein
MSLEQIDAKLEKLSAKTNYQLEEVLQQLEIEEYILDEWISNIANLAPEVIDDQQFFSAQQLKTLKKIKKILVEQGRDIKELALLLDTDKPSLSKTKNKKPKKHYFEEENPKQNPQLNNQDPINEELDENISQLSINFNHQANQDELDNIEDNHDLKIDLASDQENLDDNNKAIFDDNLINKIDPKAKITDFSNIKLYNIHPRLKEQIEHRLKCTRLNLEELNNLLKSL